MNNLFMNLNLNNLTDKERDLFIGLAQKASGSIRLSDVAIGDSFNVAGIEFIKFVDENGVVTAVVKDSLFDAEFGNDNNLSTSKILKKLKSDILPKIEKAVGKENVIEFETDLLSFDGLDTYGTMKSKVSLVTLDFYRKHRRVFDKYKLNKWWWLATPWSTSEADSPYSILCVTPYGDIDSRSYYYYYDYGVRPFFRFVSSILVS